MNVYINNFVRRQTAESRFSHYDGPLETVALLVAENLDNAKQGYREGVLEVSVPVEGFYSGVVELKGGEVLRGGFESRHGNETPRKFVEVVGAEKMPAKYVNIILYTSELLAESEQNNFEGGLEIISINASPCADGKEPLNPETLMANFYGADGGTDTKMSYEEFVEALRISYMYWRNKAMCGGV